MACGVLKFLALLILHSVPLAIANNSFYLFSNYDRVQKDQVPFSAIQDDGQFKNLALTIGARMQEISNRELAVSYLQEQYDNFEYTNNYESIENKFALVSDKLERKLNDSREILTHIKELITNEEYKSWLIDEPKSVIYPCFDVRTTPKNDSDFIQRLQSTNYNLTNIFFNYVTNNQNAIKQMYFLPHHDVVKNKTLYNHCFHYDTTFQWKQFIQRVSKFNYNVVIILNNENLTSNHQLTKQLIISIVEMLDATNHFYFTFTSSYYTNCENKFKFLPATEKNKHELLHYIDSYLSMFSSLHVANKTVEMTFERVINGISRYGRETNEDENVMILYLSAGETRENIRGTLEFLSKSAKKRSKTIVSINTCLIGDATKDELQTRLMQDLAQLNYDWYGIENDYRARTGTVKPGIYLELTSADNLGLIPARFYMAFWSEQERRGKEHRRLYFEGFKLTQLHCDPLTKEVLITLSVGLRSTNLMSTIGFDLYANTFFEDLYSEPFTKDSYFFAMTPNGTILVHSVLFAQQHCHRKVEQVHVTFMESIENFDELLNKMLTQERGVETLVNRNNETHRYRWRNVQNLLIVCAVSKREQTKRRLRFISIETIENFQLIHHRLDLVSFVSVCRHLRQPTTFDYAALHLSAGCFTRPYVKGKLNVERSTTILQSYMAYLKDHTDLIVNPGLKPFVKQEVASLYHAILNMKNQHLTSALRQYTVRCYVASTNGVLQVFPGTTIDPNFELSKRPWYRKALEFPGRVVFTAPYLDTGGAGYIVTIAHTVYEGNRNSMHAARDHVSAIVAIDLTLGYFYKLLMSIASFCQTGSNLVCFLMEDRGYLIAHPGFYDDASNKPYTKQMHIVNKESLVANDMLNQTFFVRKILCNNFADGTMQRYYQFNTSFIGVVKNTFPGEHCLKYYMTAIPGTNLFLGVVNSTCRKSATFCPCSTIDRLCLNCNRMEQNECECPCECPLKKPIKPRDTYQCRANQVWPQKIFMNNTVCPFIHTEFVKQTARGILNDAEAYENNMKRKNMQYYLYDDNDTSEVMFKHKLMSSANYLSLSRSLLVLNNLKSCNQQMHCEGYVTFEACLGIVGCEWCHQDLDGEKLSQPFCAAIMQCFNGIVGSISPYGGASLDIIQDDFYDKSYYPIGPITSSLALLGVILFVIGYFYRHSNLLAGDRVYCGDSAANGDMHNLSVRLNHLDYDPGEDHELCHRDMLISYNLETVSPYRAARYRRPNTATADSDHGYSTMTPHDESENLSVVALGEPLVSNVSIRNVSGRRNSSLGISSDDNLDEIGFSDDNSVTLPNTLSSTTTFGSPQASLTSDVTHLKNVLLVPVTVHRSMETA